MWWTALIGLAQQEMQPGQLPTLQVQQPPNPLPVLLAIAAGLGLAGYVAYRVLK
jgi:hypothetical protein